MLNFIIENSVTTSIKNQAKSIKLKNDIEIAENIRLKEQYLRNIYQKRMLYEEDVKKYIDSYKNLSTNYEKVHLKPPINKNISNIYTAVRPISHLKIENTDLT